MFSCSDKTKKMLCIPAYILVSICALFHALKELDFISKDHANWMYFGLEDKPTAKKVINYIYLIAALFTLSCAVSLMMKKSNI